MLILMPFLIFPDFEGWWPEGLVEAAEDTRWSFLTKNARLNKIKLPLFFLPPIGLSVVKLMNHPLYQIGQVRYYV